MGSLLNNRISVLCAITYDTYANSTLFLQNTVPAHNIDYDHRKYLDD
jgi:hypothetical protein